MAPSAVRAIAIPAVLLAKAAHALFETGCDGVTEISQGFDATFYSYPLGDFDGFLPDYFTQSYNQVGSVTGSAQGITNINFKGHVPWSIFPESSDGTIYGQDVSVTNFGVELSGYYKAPLTGFYTFILDAQDGLSLQLGTNGNGCCGDFDSEIINAKYISALGSIVDSFNTWVAYLEKGKYYPIRLFYFNSQGDYKLKLSVLQPDLKTKTKFENVFQIDNSGLCSPATSSTNAAAPTSTPEVQPTSTNAPVATSSTSNTIVPSVPSTSSTVKPSTASTASTSSTSKPSTASTTSTSSTSSTIKPSTASTASTSSTSSTIKPSTASTASTSSTSSTVKPSPVKPSSTESHSATAVHTSSKPSSVALSSAASKPSSTHSATSVSISSARFYSNGTTH